MKACLNCRGVIPTAFLKKLENGWVPRSQAPRRFINRPIRTFQEYARFLSNALADELHLSA